MYSAPAHQQKDPQLLFELMQTCPLATLVSIENGLPQANHIPLLWQASDTEFGVLQGHVARANTLWQQHDSNIPLLAIFQGPDTYISPELSVSKARTGKVVPTWSYIAAHASGQLHVFDDQKNDGDWLEQHLAALTLVHESDRTPPWKIDDAPRDYIDAMKRAIVGFEIRIDTLQGKWKLSQKESPENRASIAAGLKESSRTSDQALHKFMNK